MLVSCAREPNVIDLNLGELDARHDYMSTRLKIKRSPGSAPHINFGQIADNRKNCIKKYFAFEFESSTCRAIGRMKVSVSKYEP